MANLTTGCEFAKVFPIQALSIFYRAIGHLLDLPKISLWSNFTKILICKICAMYTAVQSLSNKKQVDNAEENISISGYE